MTKIELKFGLLLGVGICVYTVIAHLLGFYSTNIQAGKYGDVFVIALPVVMIFLAVRATRARDSCLTFLQGLKTGTLVALVAFPISAGFLWFYHHFVNPEWLDRIVAFEQKRMEDSGISAAEIAVRLEQIRTGNSDLAQIIGGLVGTMVLGLIISAIFSLALRRSRGEATE